MEPLVETYGAGGVGVGDGVGAATGRDGIVQLSVPEGAPMVNGCEAPMLAAVPPGTRMT